MEKWLIFGCLSYFLFAVSSSIDKKFMNKKYSPLEINIFKMFFNSIILLIIGIVFFELSFNSSLLVWSLVLGSIYGISGILYFNSLKLENVSKAVPFMQSGGVLLTFVGAILIFGEKVNMLNIMGIVLILGGIYLLLYQKGKKFPPLNKALIFIVAVILLETTYHLLVKGILSNIKPINLVISMYFFASLILFLYQLIVRKKLPSIKNSKIIIASFSGAIATFCLYLALESGNASKVYPLMGLKSIFTFLFALMFLKEKATLPKVLGTIIAIVGIFFVVG